MERKGLSQEGLKLIACAAMLLDHIGALFVPGVGLRIVGRLAFPIYCFLLAEGAHYTQNPTRYALRLFLGALLAEIPFDLCMFGRLTWQYQSVMLTLLLAFLCMMTQKRTNNMGMKLVVTVLFAVAAELLRVDYGGWGVALAAVFALSRELPNRRAVQTVAVTAICGLIGGYSLQVAGVQVPVELFGAVALIPIFSYHGRKAGYSKGVQRAFYLFYPTHLTILMLIARL